MPASTARPTGSLAAGHLGDLVLGLPHSEQAPWLREADLERGAARIVFGRESGLAVFASAYLEDLGDHVAIPTRPLLTIEELRAELDIRTSKKWVSRLGGAHHFAPQVADAATRIAFARAPVVLVADGLGSRRWAAPSAVPLTIRGVRRHLVMQSYLMKSSWEAAFRRGRVIERIVDDGAMPP